jgi:S-DNA-T family DNA segregation ATPase FtsK/SpoIIIE
MTDSGRRGRRIHVPTASDDWNRGRPAAAGGAGAGGPTDRSVPQVAAPSQEPSAGEIEAARRVELAREDLRVRASSVLGRVSAAVPAAAQFTAGDVQAKAEAVVASRTAAQQAAQAAAAGARAADEHERRTAMAALGDIADALAPGAWSEDLATVGTQPCVPKPGQLVRVGTFSCDGAAGMPALVPLVDAGGWHVEAPSDQAHALILNTLVRVIAQTPVKHLTIQVFDPHLRGRLGILAPLRSVEPQTFPEPVQQASAFVDRLGTVLASAAQNAELVVRAGRSSFADLWTSKSVPVGKLNVVVVLDYPTAVSDDMVTALQTLASVQGSAGTCLIVHTEPGAARAPGTASSSSSSDRVSWLAPLTHFTRAGDAWVCDRLPDGATFTSEPPLAAPAVSGLLARVSEAAASVEGPSVPLDDVLAAELAAPWSSSAAVSLDALIGRVDDDPLTLSFRTENPPHPNMLIGGAVGQGKSTLLLDLIYSLAVKYSPGELELYLLDFKRGLEFNRFAADASGRNWLPHMRALSLESSEDFGVAVLAHMDQEMERRSELFKEVGANSIDSYRKLSGRPMPRVLLVIDEFHVLFSGEDDTVEEGVKLLSQIAKQGRAYGIHILLSSQTISGIAALATKGDAIFSQFPLRVSLKNTAAESQAILSQGNTAASELTYRGEIIVNRDFGSNVGGANIRGLAAYVDSATFAAIQAELWQRGHASSPMVFLSKVSATWDHAALAQHEAKHSTSRTPGTPASSGSALELWVGMPIAVTQEPATVAVNDDVDQTIAILGPHEQLARQAVSSMMITAVSQLAGGRLVLLDGSGEADQEWWRTVAAYASRFDVETHVVPREDIARYLLETIGPDLDGPARPRHTMVLAMRLQRARGMDTPAPVDRDPDDDNYTYAEPVTARTVLAGLAQQGELSGYSLIGWWANLRSLEADLGVSGHGVGTFVTADLGQEDLRSLAGPQAKRPAGSPRLGVFDRSGDVGLATVIPFAFYSLEETS